MSLNGALGIANGGLSNISLGLSVVSQNVANASTPQYAVEAATQTSLSAGGQGFGVQSGVVLRATDAALSAQLSGQIAQGAANQTASTALSALQPVLGTVGGGTDLGSQLVTMQSAFSALLGDPGDATQQGAAVASAQGLAMGINTLSGAYGQARQAAQDNLATGIGQLSTELSKMGLLSKQIISLRGQGQSTADLENQRAQAEQAISQLVDARFLDQPNGDAIVLSAGGVQLPTTGTPSLSIAGATTGPTLFYPGGGLPGIMLGTSDITAQMTGGSIGGNLALRDTTLPTYQGSLDEFAHALSGRFADQGLTLFSDGTGKVPPGTGPAPQAGYVGYSGAIQVNPAVTANPALIRDGTQAVAGSPAGASAFTPNATGLAGFSTMITRVLSFALGSQAQAGVPQVPVTTGGLGPGGALQAGFGAQATLLSYADAQTASQAADSASATGRTLDTQAVVTTLASKLTGETGVSMDTELGHMVVLQQAYGANAKIISAVEALFTETLAMVT